MAGWLIATGDFVRTGGQDAANWHLARHLARSGPVELVAHRVDDELAALPNVTVTRVAKPWNRIILGQPLLRRTAEARARIVLAAGGRAVANGDNAAIPDINWVHYVHSAFKPRIAGSWLRRAKTHWYQRHHARREREAFRIARVILCNSRLSARHVVELCGADPARTKVVYLGGDPERLKAITPDVHRAARIRFGWDDRPWAVYVGSLGDRRKGFDTLYAAWRELCRDPRWDANLAVVGRGAELEAWKQRRTADGLEERMHFLGFRTDVPEVLAACDVIVHPARYEAYGLGVHEAICRGLPAIVTAQCGVAEVFDDSLAELTLPDPENADELAARLRHWRANLDSYRTRVRPLADRLRARSWDRVAEDFVAAAAP